VEIQRLFGLISDAAMIWPYARCPLIVVMILVPDVQLTLTTKEAYFNVTSTLDRSLTQSKRPAILRDGTLHRLP
jgi:hypothetical protein